MEGQGSIYLIGVIMTTLHPLFAQILRPYAPPLSELHRVAVDREMHRDKLANGYDTRNESAAFRLQMQRQDAQGGPL